jgi:hypothetical protein
MVLAYFSWLPHFWLYGIVHGNNDENHVAQVWYPTLDIHKYPWAFQCLASVSRYMCLFISERASVFWAVRDSIFVKDQLVLKTDSRCNHLKKTKRTYDDTNCIDKYFLETPWHVTG